MFEQAELQGTQMGPNGPPNAKGTTQIAPEIAIYRNQAFLVILAVLAKTAIFVILASHFRDRVDTPKKVPLVVLFRSTSPGYVRFWPRPLPREARQNFRRPGL